VVSWDRSPVVLAGLQHQRKDIISLLEAWIAANIGDQTLDDLVVAPSMRRQFPAQAPWADVAASDGRQRGHSRRVQHHRRQQFAQFVQQVTFGPENVLQPSTSDEDLQRHALSQRRA